jgi:hypothetical protein
MFGQKQPKCVSWSPQTGIGDTEDLKHISHDEIGLWASRPKFDKDETSISLGVFNRGRKALGFGASGIGLALIYRTKTENVTCRILRTLTRDFTEQEHQRLTVDIARSRGENQDFNAVFDSAEKPIRVELLIQANRIFSAPYLFRFPFQMDSDETPLNPPTSG